MGIIGTRVACLLKAFGVKEIIYYSRERKPEIEKEVGARFVNMDDLLFQSDVVTLHASKEAGAGYIGKEELAKMKDGAILIDCGFMGGVDADALFAELSAGRLRAAQDDAVDDRYKSLPLNIWFGSNSHTAFNTEEANKTASDMAVKSLLSLLETGSDPYKVN